MNFYTVHEPPDASLDGSTDPIERAEKLVFIHDGMTKAAVPLGPLWLIGNGLWLAAAAYLAVLAVIALVVFAFGMSPAWLSLSFGAMNLWLGFEAASLKRWTLERRGWATLGTVSGKTLDEAERRFLETYLDGLRSVPRQTREQEFVATVAALRGGGTGLAAMAGEHPMSGGRLSTEGGGRSWLPAWLSGRRG